MLSSQSLILKLFRLYMTVDPCRIKQAITIKPAFLSLPYSLNHWNNSTTTHQVWTSGPSTTLLVCIAQAATPTPPLEPRVDVEQNYPYTFGIAVMLLVEATEVLHEVCNVHLSE